MKTEKGGIILFILAIVFLCGLVIGGAFLLKQGNILKPKTTTSGPEQNYDSNIGIHGDSFYVKMDLSQTPTSPELLKHHMNHCNSTPDHKWDGSKCVESAE